MVWAVVIGPHELMVNWLENLAILIIARSDESRSSPYNKWPSEYNTNIKINPK